jgi:uncharacterized protein (PEP-CTERM system associated)
MHRTRRTVWNLSYDDAVVTSRGNFLLPGDLDPLTGLPSPTPAPAPLGDLFNPGLPTVPAVPAVPVVPRLPTGTVNFFSNRFSLQTQMRASVALRGGRTAAVFNAFKVRREALSTRAVDTDLLGTPIDSLNDNIEQIGVGTVLSYRLTPRSSLIFSADVADNESITTGFKARSSATRLRLTHQIARRTSAAAELRRVTGATGLTTGAKYTENAVSVSLNMQL